MNYVVLEVMNVCWGSSKLFGRTLLFDLVRAVTRKETSKISVIPLLQG
jgi:hypothetical protein